MAHVLSPPAPVSAAHAPLGLRGVHAFPAALAGVDLGATCRELDSVLRTGASGARAVLMPTELGFTSTRYGLARIASYALESDRLARVVVTHLAFAPFVTGIALALHPRPEFDAPLLLADLMVLPPGTSRALLAACGPSATGAPSWGRFQAPLAKALDDGEGPLRRGPVPSWLAPHAGAVDGKGAGATLRGARGQGGALAARMVRFVATYLEALAEAPRAASEAQAEANLAQARAARDVVRANGPAGKHLTRTFGAAYAGDYLRFFWRDAA